jgi:hypothetical protein
VVESGCPRIEVIWLLYDADGWYAVDDVELLVSHYNIINQCRSPTSTRSFRLLERIYFVQQHPRGCYSIPTN